MKNPYEILEVSEKATDDEIKAAYKNLVKKYHPDKYINNPLADLAEEKLKEINEAYSQIKNQRNSFDNLNSRENSDDYNRKYERSYENYQYTDAQKQAKYRQVISYINSRRYSDAYNLLNMIKERDSDWFYLSGITLFYMGWYQEAYRNIDIAISMNPNNNEYRKTKDQMNSMRNIYNNSSTTYYNSQECRPCCMDEACFLYSGACCISSICRCC